jgi:hypothetical protein
MVRGVVDAAFRSAAVNHRVGTPVLATWHIRKFPATTSSPGSGGAPRDARTMGLRYGARAPVRRRGGGAVESFTGGKVTIALLGLAAIPVLETTVASLKLPFGIALEFDKLKEKVANNEDMFRELVVFGLGFFPYAMLKRFAHDCPVVWDGTDEHFKDNLLTLLEHGLIQPKEGQPKVDPRAIVRGQNLAERIQPTPIGHRLVWEREAAEEKYRRRIASHRG